MALTLEMIKKLREETGAGIMDCRNALQQADEDYGAALGVLRQQGLEKAAKKSDRPVMQGVIELYTHGNGRVGVMLELNSETDFSARSAAFRRFAHELALQIAAAAPRYVRDEDIPAEVLAAVEQEAAERARQEGKPENLIARITAGRLEKFKDEAVLLRQKSIRDETVPVTALLAQAIAAVGENIVIQRFVRWELGELNAE